MQQSTIFAIGFIAGFFLYLLCAIVALLYFTFEEENLNEDQIYYDDIF
jgi:hypothetical protein